MRRQLFGLFTFLYCCYYYYYYYYYFATTLYIFYVIPAASTIVTNLYAFYCFRMVSPIALLEDA